MQTLEAKASGVARIVSDSENVGTRQSFAPAKPPPLFNVDRNPVKSVPLPANGAPVLQVYTLSLSCTQLSSVFCSHTKPLRLSVTVPSLLAIHRLSLHAPVYNGANLYEAA